MMLAMPPLLAATTLAAAAPTDAGATVVVPIWLLVAASVVVLACFGLGFWAWRKLRRETAGLRALVAELRGTLGRALEQRDDMDRRRQELFDKIEGILGESKGWQERYWEQARAHGVAQEMLFTEREYLMKQIRAVGKQPKVDNRIEQIVKAYQAEHAGPAAAALAKAQGGSRAEEKGEGNGVAEGPA